MSIDARFPPSRFALRRASCNTSRRHFLRGMGVALALPWMESLPVFGQAAAV
jgi:hypothetical protein